MADYPVIDLMHLFQGSVAHAIERQRDGSLFDLRALGAVIASELLVSNDPSEMSRVNAAVRIPTTLDHPGIK